MAQLIAVVRPGQGIKAGILLQLLDQQGAAQRMRLAKVVAFGAPPSPQFELAFGTDPLAFGIPDGLVLPVAVPLSDALQGGTAQGHGHLDARVPAAHVDPGDGQGWTALERIPGQQRGSAALTQLIATDLAWTLLRQPFRKGRQDQIASIDGGGRFWGEAPSRFPVGGEAAG